MLSKNRRLVAIWLFILAAPFLSALILAISVTAEHGSRKLEPSWTTALSNFSSVLLKGDTPYEFAICFGTSSVLCLTTALSAVWVAVPVARSVGTKWRNQLWIAAAVAIGVRVVPVTAPVPVFEGFGRLLHAPNSWILVVTLYTLMLLPLACALLSAAEWTQFELNMRLLAMDAPLSLGSALSQAFKALGPDLRITGGAVFLLTWSDFVIASFFLPTGDSTISRLLANKQSFLGTEWGRLGAAITICALPVFAASWVISRAVKGRMRLSHEQT